MTPWLVQAQVIGYYPDDPDTIQVSFRSAQIPGLPVKIGHQGYADPLRVHQRPLPQRGTWGLVAFPNGDIRNGVWLCSYYSNQQDAITSPPDDPTVDYHAHWSGFWSMLDRGGNFAMQWPDGTSFVAASGSGLPTTYRHIVDENQTRQRVAYPLSARVSGSVPTFWARWAQPASGTSISVDPSGNTTVSGASGAVLTFTFNGADIKIDAQGNIHVDVPAGKVFDITQGGGSPIDALVLVSKFLAQFNAHVHTGVTAGSANTGTPATPLTSGMVESTIIDISN